MKRAQKVRPTKLRNLYRGLLTASQVHRVEVLKTALQWFDQALEYCARRNDKDFTSVESLALLVTFSQQRRKGITATTIEEKQEAFYTAIQAAEQLCKRLHPYSIQKAYKEYSHYAEKSLDHHLRLGSKYKNLIDTIESSLQPGLSIRVVEADKKMARVLNRSASQYVYNRQEAKAAQSCLRKRGLLSLVVRELRPISRALAIEEDGEGGFKVNPEKQVQAIFLMLDNFLKYCGGSDVPRRLVKGVK